MMQANKTFLQENRTFLQPKRIEDESYEDYMHRRKAGNDYVKNTRTKMFWDSYNKGTYFSWYNATQYGQGIY
jgi:hypothetical protein